MTAMRSRVSFILALVANVASACTISPLGVGNGIGEIPASHVTDLQANLNLPYLWLPMVAPASDNIVANYETPIQFRISNMVGMNSYNTLAPYQETALDVFGRGHRRICVDEFEDAEALNAHEQMTGAYAFAYTIILAMPETKATITNVMDNVLGLPMSNLDGNPDEGTPWGLVKALVDEVMDFVSTDGWNADGSLTNANNKMPFRDFDYTDEDGNTYTHYKPNPEVSDFGGTCSKIPEPWKWEPLVESNNFGFFCKQEHVTPHIGFTGRLMGVTEEEYESFSTPLPDYDYCAEADLALEKTRLMAESDEQKMEVEFFDNKFFSLLPLQINWQIAQGFSLFDFWLYDMALDIAIYDAVMLVWRDKILFDLVRPTTVVHALKSGETVQSYGGPGEGEQTMDGGDWQPYIRTMPHAEYPSGSACLCTTFAEVMIGLTGSDETNGLPLQQVFPAGSSKKEPGMTPASDLTFTYTTWSETNEACGRSRENGGMHFSQAVPAGNELCTGLAALVVDKALKLQAGDPSGAMADFDDRSIRIKSKSYDTAVEQCTGCHGTTAGPCQQFNGVCHQFLPTGICPTGSQKCNSGGGGGGPEDCDNCYGSTSGPCQQANGVCHSMLPYGGCPTGTSLCHNS